MYLKNVKDQNVSRETFYKNCVKQKKCSDIAELLGNHQKMQNHRRKNSKKPLNSVKIKKNYCKTVLFKMFHVKHRQKSPIFLCFTPPNHAKMQKMFHVKHFQ